MSSDGLRDLFSYPLTAALQDRRTRRVAQGVSLPHGAQPYESGNSPSPLTAVEEAVLIASTSITGAVMHDGPTSRPDGSREFGTMFLDVAGRAAPSADNAHAAFFFMVNDEGVWLIERPRGRAAVELLRSIPPRWEDRTEADWLAFASAVKRKVHDGRLAFPLREWPYYMAWNGQFSNVPGTTCFLPMVDVTRQYINGLLILLSEPLKPLFVDDWQRFKPSGALEWAAWFASKVGLVEPIPYQPIGGIKRVRGGWVDPKLPAPMTLIGNGRSDFEASFLLQNLMLTAEALRLGGWVHGAPMFPYIWQRDEAAGVLGLGFREHGGIDPGERWRRWPPLPGSQPNYVGIDGVLEGLCPPYVRDMDEAVDRVLEDKFGAGGVYTDLDVFGQAYRDRSAAETYVRAAAHPSHETITYVKEICRYIAETYGRFPAHADAFHMPGIWVQFSHLEIEYYERFAAPEHARRAAEGRQLWGR